MTQNIQATNKALPSIVLLLGIVLLVALLIALFDQYIYYLRIPILGILFLVLLPLISRSSMLRNLFIFHNKWQLVLVIAAVPIAGLAITNIFDTILSEAPTRFNFTPPSGWELVTTILSRENAITVSPLNGLTLKIEPLKDIFAVLLGSLISITAISRSKKDSELSRYLNNENPQTNKNPSEWLLPGVLIGLLLAIVFIFLVNVSTNLINDYIKNDRTYWEQQVINVINLLPQEARKGYLTQSGGLTPSHVGNLGFLLVVSLVYIGSGIWGRSLLLQQPSNNGQTTEEEKFNVPALFYLMLITAGLILLFGALTFFLDYYLVPVLLVFLIFSALMYRLFNVDHYYQLKRSEKNNPVISEENQAIADFKQALQQRLAYQGEENRTLVVVCASGGGIQAAGWTVQVLTGLQQALDEEKPGLGTKFTKSIGLISSVSGSSVGTMYYLNCFQQQDGCPPEAEFIRIFNDATANSLDATGWGLAYPDLWRFIGFPWIPTVLKLGDRGTAIEIDWQGHLNNHRETPGLINTWREQALAGTIPIPVFNATLVDNGYRFLLSPMTFIKQSNQGKKYQDFNSLYGKYNYDIDVTAAARLSATFPYVTPIARNLYPRNHQEQQHNYHVADGGYFDNFGVFTTVEWLDKVILNNLKDDLRLQKVIILQINAFRPSASTSNNSSTKKGWLMSLAGPLLAVFKVRSSTQTDRNDLEIRVLQEKWKNSIDIEHVKVEPPKIEYSDFRNKEKSQSLKNYWQLFVNSRGEYNPPLSWKLSDFEKEMIKLAWKKIKDKVVGDIKPKL
ncbi:MAG: patatin-like phospholipase family protein [Symploca sp. SIO2G7]|nr:patatin-like phospholipase family protein [Symploca sp. SIO2G7]